MKMQLSLVLATMLATLGLPLLAVAQTPRSEAQRNQIERTRDNTPAAERRTDDAAQPRARQNQTGDDYNQELVNFLAAKLMLANECQIAFASMAAEKAENSEVQQFAAKLKQEHQQLNDELKQALPGLSRVQSAKFAHGSSTSSDANSRLRDSNRTSATERRTAESTSDQTRSATARDSQVHHDAFLDGGAQTLIDICRRAVENNHEATKQMLSQKQGRDFDRCFMASQIGAHTLMVSELKAIQDLGPREFSSFVQQAEQKTKQHLEKAKQIAESLEKNAGSGQAGTTDRNVDQLSQDLNN